MSFRENLGLKSYSFNEIEDNRAVAAAVKSCGVRGIDLSGSHVDYDDPTGQEEVLAIYGEAGIRISGIGVVKLQNDQVFNRRFFDFAAKAGCKLVSASFLPEGHESILKSLEKFCEEYGLRVAIHNHGGKHWLGNSTILRYIFSRTSPLIGLCLDTAWCIQAGEDPITWIDAFGDRLYGVHLKDFRFDENGRHYDTILGEGTLDLPATIKRIADLYTPDSSFVIEYEGENPVEMSKRCVEAIDGVL